MSRDALPPHPQATLRAPGRSPRSHADRIQLELRRTLLSGGMSARLTEAGLAEHVVIADDVPAGEPARVREHVRASADVVERRVGAVLARMFETAAVRG